jgi:hypothetical protein
MMALRPRVLLIFLEQLLTNTEQNGLCGDFWVVQILV